MPFNTFSVGAAVTPSVIETSFSHYLNRKPLRQKPTAHISYHVGLRLIRQFLDYASHHTVEDLQAFTSQWVPSARWVRTEEVSIPQDKLLDAATHIVAQLGPRGVDAIGGELWWRWRPQHLRAEWIEMRKDHNAHAQNKEQYRRSMLYVHGGAYFFGSVDEHRYQIQRHARKLQARVLAPRYRLAPQFPFPCGLLDCLASYLQLLTMQSPDTIILAGDSAGAAMVVSMLVILRDQGIPLPAGAVLLSPWVDLSHSFPSVADNNTFDYVPPHGFLARPSMAWPPPSADEMKDVQSKEDATRLGTESSNLKGTDDMPQMTDDQSTTNGTPKHRAHATRQSYNEADYLSIDIDGEKFEIKDQIQMYAPNHLLAHPLVSPVMQPSLGGLPPLLVLAGGGEMLRDEQIYLAHKAAAPGKYPPSDSVLQMQQAGMKEVTKWPPTNTMLQVWDDMCHVAPTLSFTRPAKFMYRSVAQFGAWALARAQKSDIKIVDDEEVSVISKSSTQASNSSESKPSSTKSPSNRPSKPMASSDEIKPVKRTSTASTIGRAGDDLPPFVDHMIRQRVTRHGDVHPLPPPSELAACTMKAENIGTIKPGPVRKWMGAQAQWAARFQKEKGEVRRRRTIEMKKGYLYTGFEGDRPPPTALAGRRGEAVLKMEEEMSRQRAKKSKAMALWSGWGSKHDEEALENEQARNHVDKKTVQANGGTSRTRSRVFMRTISDMGQTNEIPSQPSVEVEEPPPIPLIAENSNQRPGIGNVAYPFKLAEPITGEVNASTMTLTSDVGVAPPRLSTSVTPLPASPAPQTPTNEASQSADFVTPMEDPAKQTQNPIGLFAGSGHIWDDESLGRPTPDRVRPELKSKETEYFDTSN